MKRQDSVLSSSSRRENVPVMNHHSKTMGCMSGIFHLVYKYHNNRKFLTFGRRKQEKKKVVSNCGKKGYEYEASTEGEKKKEVGRSPMLSAEIRRWKSAEKWPKESAGDGDGDGEKRKQLLRALEKCDEDLKALKKMVEAAEVGILSGHFSGDHREREREFFKNILVKTTPVSLLHHRFTTTAPPPFACSIKPHTTGRVVLQQQRKRPGEEDIINLCIFNRISTQPHQSFQRKKEKEKVASPIWSSKGMIESVNEACRDIAWGEKREVGRIGLALQDHIYRDVIDEFVREMGCYSLPFEACKRRLCF